MGCAASSTGLPLGGFHSGDQVYYHGATKNVNGSTDSSELVFGAIGEVVGWTCPGKIVLKTPSAGRVYVTRQEISRAPPLIPEGFKLGDEVFYGGPGRKYTNGDKLTFGAKGTVAGMSCVGDGMDRERVSIAFPEHKGSPKSIRCALLSYQTPCIPGGYIIGQEVYWCGMNWVFPNGDRLIFGASGRVAGRSCVGDGLDDERVAVHFPGNKGAVAMRLPEISRDSPKIPGGYAIGDRVYYCYPNWRSPSGQVLLFGVQGKVIGRSCIGDGKDDDRVWVRFVGLGYGCICLEQISREFPVIPGEYKLGDKVYYGGPRRPGGSSGGSLVFGSVGTIAGKATSSKSDVAALFPGHTDTADVLLSEISRTYPVLPWDFQFEDSVYYCGPDLPHDGKRQIFGTKGQVAGRACFGDERDQEMVSVFLQASVSPVQLRFEEISRDPPDGLKEVLENRVHSALSLPIELENEPLSPAGFLELAMVHQTAVGANYSLIAGKAFREIFSAVALAKRNGDLSRLSYMIRAAEDVDWAELRTTAFDSLQEATLPKVLKTAMEADDALGVKAVFWHAHAAGMELMAMDASSWLNKVHGTDLNTLWSTSPKQEDSSDTVLEHFSNRSSCGILAEEMQELLNETYTGWGGFGKRTRTRDRPNEQVADRLQVERVEKLVNPRSYLRYLVRRQVIAAELPENARTDWKVRTSGSCDLSPVADSVSSASPKQFMARVNPELNEHYLWHGTGPAEASGIAAEGFDLCLAGSCRGALFGRGLYFAESCLKADEYVRKDASNQFPLVLCRVTLGSVNYCDAEDPSDIREMLQLSCRAGEMAHHSVLGDREKVRQTFREFVIFDCHQAYPEYIVWYSRK